MKIRFDSWRLIQLISWHPPAQNRKWLWLLDDSSWRVNAEKGLCLAMADALFSKSSSNWQQGRRAAPVYVIRSRKKAQLFVCKSRDGGFCHSSTLTITTAFCIWWWSWWNGPESTHTHTTAAHRLKLGFDCQQLFSNYFPLWVCQEEIPIEQPSHE